jgi:hypothetical protein
MKYGFLFVPIGLCLLPVAVGAQEQGRVKTVSVKEKKSCRQLMPTGTIMSSRVCNTAEGWRMFEASGKAGADDFNKALRMTSTGVSKP